MCVLCKNYMQQSPEQGTLLPEILKVTNVHARSLGWNHIVCLALNIYRNQSPPPPPVSLRPDSGSWPPLRGFVVTLIGHTTLGRTPLDEWSARHKDLYLTTHNTHKRQISLPPAGFEPTIRTSKRPQTHALYCVATGIGTETSWKYR
jgi:hypothetical protein